MKTKQEILRQYNKAKESLLSICRMQDNYFSKDKYHNRIYVLDKWLTQEYKKNGIKVCLPSIDVIKLK